jgi:Family of unknown function (DUF6687)
VTRLARRQFVASTDLAGRACITVDGAPVRGTVLTLSHWPHTPTPAELAEDTSAEIGFRYLEDPRPWPDAELVTNDHFDQDGLVAAFTLVDPEEAFRRREVLCEVASAGDFATFSDLGAARVSFALATLADPARSPLDVASLPYGERTAALYLELIGRLADLVDHPERHRELWEEEDKFLAQSRADLDRGSILVEEIGELDMAVVTVQEKATAARASRFATVADMPFHPAVVNNSTDATLLAVLQARRYELRYRYESWVRMVSRRPRPRVDLAPLAERLNQEEPDYQMWTFDGVAALEPVMRLVGRRATAEGRGEVVESTVSRERFLELTMAHLGGAPPAWDPYASAPSASR